MEVRLYARVDLREHDEKIHTFPSSENYGYKNMSESLIFNPFFMISWIKILNCGSKHLFLVENLRKNPGKISIFDISSSGKISANFNHFNHIFVQKSDFKVVLNIQIVRQKIVQK